MPLWFAAGRQAVRTEAQTSKHLSHNHDKELLAYINMPYKIKGLSRFFCACARCPALFLHQEPHRMRHAVRALTSSLDRQVSLIVRPWCLSPLLKRVDLAFIERGCHTVLLGPACAFKQKVTVSPWKKPIVFVHDYRGGKAAVVSSHSVAFFASTSVSSTPRDTMTHWPISASRKTPRTPRTNAWPFWSLPGQSEWRLTSFSNSRPPRAAPPQPGRWTSCSPAWSLGTRSASENVLVQVMKA